MSDQQPSELWQTIRRLPEGGTIEISSIGTPDDALMVLISGGPGRRNEAIHFLSEYNAHRKILWGSITPYLVVLYLLIFQIHDLEAASFLKQLLENTRNEVALSQSDADMLRLLNAALSLKQLGVGDLSKAKKFLAENLSESNPDPLSSLLSSLIYSKLGGRVDLRREIENLGYSMRRSMIEPDVAEQYLIPDYESNPIAQDFFLQQAISEQSRQTEYTGLRENEERLKRQIELKEKSISGDRQLLLGCRIIILEIAVVSFVITSRGLIVSSIDLAHGIPSLLASVIVAALSLPIPYDNLDRLPKLIVKFLAWMYTVGDRVRLRTVRGQAQRLEVSNEP